MRVRLRFVLGAAVIVTAVAYLIFTAIRTTSEYYLTVNEVSARQSTIACSSGARAAGDAGLAASGPAVQIPVVRRAAPKIPAARRALICVIVLPALIEAPFAEIAPCVGRGLGRLEPLDAETAKLVGSTSNPTGYAEQLARVPAPSRIIRGPEVQAATRARGQRLLAASAGDA